MKKNRILIYMNKNELRPTGGPFGYLYNLKKGLDELKVENIEFLNINVPNNKKNKLQIYFKKIYNMLPKSIKEIFKNYKTIKYYNTIMKEENSKIELNNYGYIHFHSSIDMYKLRKVLLNYNGKVILTSHSPKPLYLEKIDYLIDSKTNKIVKEKLNNLEKIDIYAFENADYIVFPCQEAEEPYYNQWNKYKEIKEKNKEKYRYILTGISKCTAKISKEEIRKQYKIPQDAFLISYVGRHNEVKGYDVLKKIGQKILKDNNIYIIVAGKEGPLYKYEHKNWIEVGWTDDPHSIIAASDLFILPNRETYFDLILLEVLSLGVPMLISDTGGNKFFYKNYNDIGIEYFSNIEDAINNIQRLSKLEKNELKQIGEKNKKIYEKDFNEKIFAQNYIKLIESLEKEK